MVASAALKALGLALTWIGLALLLYALASPFIYGKPYIGSKEAWTPDAIAVILGWFMVIIGPAIAYGERPVAIEKMIKRR